MDHPHEFHERIAIIMEGDNRSEAEAIQMAQQQRREAESRRMIRERESAIGAIGAVA